MSEISEFFNRAIYWLASFGPTDFDFIGQIAGGVPLIQLITASAFCYTVLSFSERSFLDDLEPHLLAIFGTGAFFVSSSWFALVKGAQLAVRYRAPDPLAHWEFVGFPIFFFLAALLYSVAILWLRSSERREGY